MRGGYHPIGWNWQQFNAKRSAPRAYRTPEEKRLANREWWRAHRRKPADPNGRVQAAEPPPREVELEYAEALTQPRTITAEQFGDPLPGRSALDRRKIHEPA